GDPDLSEGITADAIEIAIARTESELDQLVERRSVLIAEVRDQSWTPDGQLGEILEHRSITLHRKERYRGELATIADRIAELEEYDKGLKREAQRLDRADAAADVLEDIKVTHCPACDQSVEDVVREANRCFLCRQTTLSPELTGDAAARRLRF